MKKTLCLLMLGLMVGLCAYAGDEMPKADVFLGYSFMRYNSAQTVPAFTANGGVGTVGWNFNRYIGAEGEFGGYHNGNISGHEFDTTVFSYMFGPRASLNRSKTIIPYVHALWGGQDAHTSICCVAPSTGVGPPPTTGSRVSRDQNGFAQAYGGGLDIKLSKGIVLRPIQFDYVMTRFQAVEIINPSGPSTNRNQHNLRYAAGVVFNIGGAR